MNNDQLNPGDNPFSLFNLSDVEGHLPTALNNLHELQNILSSRENIIKSLNRAGYESQNLLNEQQFNNLVVELFRLFDVLIEKYISNLESSDPHEQVLKYFTKYPIFSSSTPDIDALLPPPLITPGLEKSRYLKTGFVEKLANLVPIYNVHQAIRTAIDTYLESNRLNPALLPEDINLDAVLRQVKVYYNEDRYEFKSAVEQTIGVPQDSNLAGIVTSVLNGISSSFLSPLVIALRTATESTMTELFANILISIISCFTIIELMYLTGDTKETPYKGGGES